MISEALQSKVDAAVELVKTAAARAQNPMVMSSFGKDSMVLLALIARAGLRIPVVFHREAFEPKKYAFANRVIENNGYVTYDWAPTGMNVVQRDQHFEIVNRHQEGPDRYGYLPIGIREWPGAGRFLCGLEDLYCKPTGNFIFPWDLAFVGHKNCDVDPILGAVPLESSVVENPGYYTLAFPLREFTDTEIWEYTVENGIPINHGRYDKDNGWKERGDLSANPDYFTACTRCMRRESTGLEVQCPKINGPRASVTEKLDWFVAGVPAYVKVESEKSEEREKSEVRDEQ